MERTIKQPGKGGQTKKSRQVRKYLDKILEGNLKDPPPPIMEKISDELGLDILPNMLNK